MISISVTVAEAVHKNDQLYCPLWPHPPSTTILFNYFLPDAGLIWWPALAPNIPTSTWLLSSGALDSGFATARGVGLTKQQQQERLSRGIRCEVRGRDVALLLVPVLHKVPLLGRGQPRTRCRCASQQQHHLALVQGQLVAAILAAVLVQGVVELMQLTGQALIHMCSGKYLRCK